MSFPENADGDGSKDRGGCVKKWEKSGRVSDGMQNVKAGIVR